MKRTTLGIALLALVTIHIDIVASAATYDAAADWMQTLGPNGVWNYGYELTANPTVLVPYNGLFNFDPPNVPGINVVGGFGFGDPAEYKNITAASDTFQGGITLAPGQLAVHPGGASGVGFYDSDAVVGFTAPTSGTYSLSGGFTGVDFFIFNGPGTQDQVLVNGVSIFSGTITTYQGQALFNIPNLSLTAGDTVDFTVGSLGVFITSESTGLAAVITGPNVPEPASVTLAVIGMIGLGAWGWRRRRSA